MPNQTVAVLFGGRSVEHEVSVISGHQVMDALDQAGFQVLPIYITKQGYWYAGEGLQNLDLYREQTFHAAGLKNVYRVSLSPDRSIRQLVVHPSAAGGLLGIAFGFFLSWLIASTAQWRTIVTPLSVIIAFTVSVAVGVLFGIYPAMKASRINPIDALRYE